MKVAVSRLNLQGEIMRTTEVLTGPFEVRKEYDEENDDKHFLVFRGQDGLFCSIDGPPLWITVLEPFEPPEP